MRNRVSQKEGVFYILYKRFKEKNHEYLPVFQFMGETYVKEAGKWAYVSYECSARASQIMTENPGLLQRTKIIGKSRARYYGYRLNPEPSIDMIKDPALLKFYTKISGNKVAPLPEQTKPQDDRGDNWWATM